MAYPLPSETHLLGVCTGALAATAVASSKSVTDLLPIAVQTVQVAFRLGLLAVEVSNRIQPGCSGSWSLIFPGLTTGAVSVALKEFSKVTYGNKFKFQSDNRTNTSIELSTPVLPMDQCIHLQWNIYQWRSRCSQGAPPIRHLQRGETA